MGKALYETIPAARRLYESASTILGYDLARLCFAGPAEQLNLTVHAQPALFVTSLAALERMKQDQPETYGAGSAAAGLSLGEYTALVFAGGLSFEDGLRLVQKRGEAMQAAADESHSGMVSVLGLDLPKVQQVCDAARVEGEILQVANLLCPGNIVVSGHKASCDRVEVAAASAGAMRVFRLAVAGAFHTPLMQSATGQLGQVLAKVRLSPLRLPVVSNVDALPHREIEPFRSLLLEQLCATVRWQESMERLLADGFDTFYEIGPGRVLKGLLKRIDKTARCDVIDS
jgi:[acyl-carrier-protein] S-malonyltransferase